MITSDRYGETVITQDMIRMGENSTLEFKTEDAHNDSIAKEIVAFLNLEGGDLLIGIQDDGAIAGVRNRDVEQRIIQICRNNIVPPVIPLVRFTEMENRQILHVSIAKGANRPYRVRSSGKFYIRAGSSSVEPGTEELARLFQNGELLHYEVKPVHGAGIGDLNHSYIKTYLREHRLMDDIPESEDEFLQVLLSLNFLSRKNGEFLPTVAGLILFGNAPEKFLPQCA